MIGASSTVDRTVAMKSRSPRPNFAILAMFVFVLLPILAAF